jgi:hypothetical protein
MRWRVSGGRPLFRHEWAYVGQHTSYPTFFATHLCPLQARSGAGWRQKAAGGNRGVISSAVSPANTKKKGEPTSGLEPLTCSLRVMHQALQGLAWGCKSRIYKAVSLLCLAPYCTVLRSRWCQSGVNSALVSTFDQRPPRADFEISLGQQPITSASRPHRGTPPSPRRAALRVRSGQQGTRNKSV